MKTSTLNTKAIMLASFSCLLWGSAFSVVKLGYALFGLENGTPMSRILFAGYRFTLAGAFILIAARLMRLSIKPALQNWKAIAIIGLTQTFLQYTFFYIGLFKTEAIKSSIITATGVFFSMIAAHIYFKHDALTKKKIIGSFIGFAGVIAANLTGQNFNVSFSLTGEGFILLAAITSAIANVFVSVITKKAHPVVVAGTQMTFGGIMLVLFGLIGASPFEMNYTVSGIGVLVYLSLASAAAFSIWFYLLSHYNVSSVAIHKFQIPMWGTLISIILLGEMLSLPKVIALLLVVTGIIVVNSRTDKLQYPDNINK